MFEHFQNCFYFSIYSDDAFPFLSKFSTVDHVSVVESMKRMIQFLLYSPFQLMHLTMYQSILVVQLSLHASFHMKVLQLNGYIMVKELILRKILKSI